jgi:hypothetical protein
MDKILEGIAFDMFNAPEGYSKLRCFLAGSNVQHINIYVCDRCGCMVGNVLIHDGWHKFVESGAAQTQSSIIVRKDEDETDSPPDFRAAPIVKFGEIDQEG